MNTRVYVLTNLSENSLSENINGVVEQIERENGRFGRVKDIKFSTAIESSKGGKDPDIWYSALIIYEEEERRHETYHQKEERKSK